MKNHYTVSDLSDEDKMTSEGWMDFSSNSKKDILEDINSQLGFFGLKIATVEASGMIGKKWFKIEKRS
jgi:hypothetical protein